MNGKDRCEFFLGFAEITTLDRTAKRILLRIVDIRSARDLSSDLVEIGHAAGAGNARDVADRGWVKLPQIESAAEQRGGFAETRRRELPECGSLLRRRKTEIFLY